MKELRYDFEYQELVAQMYFGSYENVYPTLVSMSEMLWEDEHSMHICSCKEMYQDIFIHRVIDHKSESEIKEYIRTKYDWLQADSDRFPDAVEAAVSFIDDHASELKAPEKTETPEKKGIVSQLIDRLILWIIGDPSEELLVLRSVARIAAD